MSERIIISFDKMNEIGGEPVSMINEKIINIAIERNKIIKTTANEIIDCILGWGNIVTENEEEIIKRNEEIIFYILSHDYPYGDKEIIKRYKKIKEIRNQGKKDWCIATDKQMITRYEDVMEIISKVFRFIEMSERDLENQLSQEHMRMWINAFIKTNGIEKLLRIYERDHYHYTFILDFIDDDEIIKLLEKCDGNEEKYEYLFSFLNKTKTTHYNWFFGRIVRRMLGLST